MYCSLSIQTQETYTLINTVLDVQPRLASSGGGKTSDEIVYELADSILAKIPDKFDIDQALPEMFEVNFFILYDACMHKICTVCLYM